MIWKKVTSYLVTTPVQEGLICLIWRSSLRQVTSSVARLRTDHINYKGA